MLQEADNKQETDILQQAVGLVKENQRLARERETAEEEIKSLAKFCMENPNPVLRIEEDGELLFSNPPGRVLLVDGTIKTGDRVPPEFHKLVSLAHSTQSIQNSEITIGTQTFYLQWVPIANTDYVNVYGRDITVRKKALKQLAQAMRNNELILNSVGEGIFGLDLQGNTTFSNPAADKMLGYTKGELLGKPQHAIIHHSKADGSPYSREDCHIYAAFKDGKVHRETEEVFWRKDGTSFPIEYVSTPIRENNELVGAVVTFKDITERKKVEQALRTSETRANAVLNNAVDGIITIDEQGVIQSFNPAAERLFSYKTSELLGVNIKLLMPEPFQSEHDRYLKKYLETGISKIIGIGREVIGLRKDGSTFPADLEISEMYLGETRMFTGMVRDITERKKAEAQQQMQYELTRTFLDSQSLDNALPKILQVIGEFMEWEIGYYWEKKPESDELDCRYVWNAPCLNESVAFKEFKENSFTRTFEKRAGLPGRVWDQLEPSWIPDVKTDANFPRAPFAEKLGMKSGFGFPVYFKRQFIGVVEIFTRQVCQPDTHRIQMMSNLGGQIGQWMRLKKAEEHLDKLNLKTFD
jgi:PAS domain S-box-containing protein